MTHVTEYSLIIEELSKEIKKSMSNNNIPGLTIALVSRKGIIRSKVFGYTDLSKKQKANQETLFCIQSSTKTFTAIAFLSAVQQGLVKIDDPIVEYYPELSLKSRFGEQQISKITFRHLLAHHAGLQCFMPVGGVYDDRDHTFKEHVEALNECWMISPAGKKFYYSNIGMDLVAYLLEKITGKSYPDYLRQVIAQPLGMNRLACGSIEARKYGNLAIGTLGKRKCKFNIALAYGCGGIYLGIDDFAKFVQFLLNKGKVNGKQVLNTKLIEEMQSTQFGEPIGQTYGFGVTIYENSSPRIFEHPGGAYGFNSAMRWIPDENIGIVVQSNQEYQEYTNQIAEKVLNLILEKKGIKPIKTTIEEFISKPESPVEPDLLRRVEGFYSSASGDAIITLEDDLLYFIHWSGKYKLTPHSPTEFTAKYPPALKIKFDSKDNNQPSHLVMLTKELMPIKLDFGYRPLEDDTIGPNLPEWQQYVGLYRHNFYAKEVGHFAIAIKNGHLYAHTASKQRLTGYEPGLFFAQNGMSVIFKEDETVIYGIRNVKIDDPVLEIIDMIEKDRNNQLLDSWVLDKLISLLKYLERKDKAMQIEEIKNELYGEKKGV
ncbi:MAG: serine hydrolase domain-containing protein [Candidatus Hodarchaeales archaeon]